MELNNLFEITCPHCSIAGVPRLLSNGPHIEADCENCGEYIKFISVKDLPTLVEVRSAIWALGNQDKRFIESCKILCRFNTKGNEFLEHWKLYRKCKQLISDSIGEQHGTSIKNSQAEVSHG